MPEAQMYNDPKGGTQSSIGPQIRVDHYIKKALMEAKKEQYFSQLADTTAMPKNLGKTIKKFHYLPLLDDANLNDQGIDAAGATTTFSFTIVITRPDVSDTGSGYVSEYACGEGADAGAAQTAAEAMAEDIFKNLNVFTTDYATTKTALEALTPPWTIDDSGTAVPARGNLYGSSKDVGTINDKLPALSETGGRKNRVGHTRIELEGSFEKFGLTGVALAA